MSNTIPNFTEKLLYENTKNKNLGCFSYICERAHTARELITQRVPWGNLDDTTVCNSRTSSWFCDKTSRHYCSCIALKIMNHIGGVSHNCLMTSPEALISYVTSSLLLIESYFTLPSIIFFFEATKSFYLFQPHSTSFFFL